MGQSLPDVRIEKTLDFFGKVWYTETYAPGRWAYAQKRLGYSQGVRQRTLTPSFRWFESSYPNQKATGFMKNPLSVMGGGFFQRKDKSMGDHKLAWILGIVTVVYLIAMILCSGAIAGRWISFRTRCGSAMKKRRQKNLPKHKINRQRASLRSTASRMRPNRKKCRRRRQRKHQRQKKRSLNPNRLRRTDAFAVRFLTHKRNICCPVR